jgi:hypothetical protein
MEEVEFDHGDAEPWADPRADEPALSESSEVDGAPHTSGREEEDGGKDMRSEIG